MDKIALAEKLFADEKR